MNIVELNREPFNKVGNYENLSPPPLLQVTLAATPNTSE
jgi:hypothetical protein